MKNDGVLYHQVPSFSPEYRTKVVLQEFAVVRSVYCLPWRYSMLQYYLINVICHNEHHFHSTLCRLCQLWHISFLPFHLLFLLNYLYTIYYFSFIFYLRIMNFWLRLLSKKRRILMSRYVSSTHFCYPCKFVACCVWDQLISPPPWSPLLYACARVRPSFPG